MFEKIFPTSAMPHGYCLSWQSGLLWLHVISNALIALAYIAIPATIYLFIRRKHQHLMHQNLLWLFAGFIIACAMNHTMGIVVIWQPYYWLQGLMMAITALVSTVTAVKLGQYLPTLLKTPTLRELQVINQKLAEQIARSQALEKKLLLTQFSVENASEGMFWIKQDASILYANLAATAHLGYEQAEFSTLTVIDLDPRLNHEMWLTLWQDLKAQKSLTFETSLLKKDRGLWQVEVTVNFIEYEGQEYHCSFVRDISRQKQQEQALKTSELMIKQAQEIAHLGYWRLDLTTKTLYWSDEIYRIFGLQPQQIEPSYQAFLDYIHPDDRDLVNQAYNNHLNNKVPYEIVHRLLLENGTVKYLNEKCKTEFDPQGHPLQSLGTVLDITAQKQAEQALQTSELMLKEAQEIAHVGHWIYELKTHHLYWSDEIYRIFGLQPQQSKPAYQQFIHPDDKAFVHQAYSKHLNQQADYDVQYRLLLKNGRVKYVSAKAKLEVDSQGQPLKSLGVMFDITEQQQAEQKIKDLLELNQKIISQSPVGVKVFKASGQCISCNKAAATTLDKSIEQILQERFYDQPLWISTHLLDSALDCLQQKQPLRQEIHTTLATGKEVWLDYHFSTFSSNHEPHLLVLIHDISEYRLVEIALQQAKLTAEQASQAKSNFIANMSHEIRTPMNAVIGMSYLMLNTHLDRQQQDLMKKIQRSSQHLMEIINDILDFSKIEAGKFELDHTEFDLEKLLDDVIALMFAKATAKSLELLLKADPAIPACLLGDPIHLNQILLNYVDNAIKFSQNGSILIEVRLKEDYEQEVLLYFAVHDKGIGLTEAQQHLLFQQFQQVDVSSTRKYGGTGMGLSISKKLAELMGGEVGVTSQYGQGSTFWFTARLVKNTVQKTRTASVAALPPPKPEPEQQGSALLTQEALLKTDPQAAEIVCRLAALLEECDAEAVELVETNRTLLQAVFTENYPLFYTLIENFDFDAAIAILKQVAATRQIKLN